MNPPGVRRTILQGRRDPCRRCGDPGFRVRPGRFDAGERWLVHTRAARARARGGSRREAQSLRPVRRELGSGSPGLPARPLDADALLADPFLLGAGGPRNPGRLDHPAALRPARARVAAVGTRSPTSTARRSASTTRSSTPGTSPGSTRRRATAPSSSATPTATGSSRKEPAPTARGCAGSSATSVATASTGAPRSRGTRAQAGTGRSSSSRKGSSDDQPRRPIRPTPNEHPVATAFPTQLWTVPRSTSGVPLEPRHRSTLISAAASSSP